MPLKSEDVIAVLKGLVEVCKDGEQGYKDAADDVKDDSVQKVLLKYSEERGLFSLELQSIVIELGGEMEFSGSISGILNRRLTDVKFGIAGSNTEAILNQCIKDDKAAIAKYEEAVKIELPSETLNVVKRQYGAVKEAYENIPKLMVLLGLNVKAETETESD